MAKKKGSPGLPFPWKRATGVTKAKTKFAKATGIPTTKAGRQRKVGKAATSGCEGTIFVVLIGIILSALALAQESAKPQETQPSLDETTEWLQEKLANYANVIQKSGDETTTRKLEDVSVDKCLIRYTYSMIANKAGINAVEFTQKIAVQFDYLDRTKISISDDKDGIFVKASLRTDKPKVQFEGLLKTTRIKRDMSNTLTEILIPFSNKDMAERVTKALVRAVELCATKKEPF